MSRVTLHRIERGAPSVTMGAYLAALFAVGLELSVVRGDFEGAPDEEGEVIRLAEYPELRRISWHLSEATELTPGQALEIYERNWRHVDKGAMPEEEKALLARLVRRHGGGRLLV